MRTCDNIAISQTNWELCYNKVTKWYALSLTLPRCWHVVCWTFSFCLLGFSLRIVSVVAIHEWICIFHPYLISVFCWFLRSTRFSNALVSGVVVEEYIAWRMRKYVWTRRSVFFFWSWPVTKIILLFRTLALRSLQRESTRRSLAFSVCMCVRASHQYFVRFLAIGSDVMWRCGRCGGMENKIERRDTIRKSFYALFDSQVTWIAPPSRIPNRGIKMIKACLQ